MTFTTGIFIIGLLPWFIILYNRLGNNKIWTRRILLILANSIFFLWGGAGSFLIICAFSVLVWLFAFIISKTKNKWLFALSLLVTLTPLIFVKYALFIINVVNSVIGCNIKEASIIVPIGISFITFEAVSLLVDIFKERIDKNPNVLDTYLYLTFFPTVTSGPIIRFSEFKEGMYHVHYECDYGASVERIIIGLCKKVLVADKIAILADYYFGGVASGNHYSCIGLWLGSIAYTIQIYFDFSGYSDMAIGMGRLLGFTIRENFNNPYQACSISEFWKRWHMSLTQWFRDYIYIPLGGNRCGVVRHLLNMLCVWLLTGIWHGTDWSFIIWGLGCFILLAAEKYIPAMKKIGKGFIGHIYTLFFVNLLWIPFRANNLGVALKFLRGMFGGGSSGIEEKALSVLPFLALAVFLCFPINKWLAGFSDKKWFIALKGMMIIILAIIAVCGIANASYYVPYIYGNF